MLRAVNEYAVPRAKLCKPGLLLINVGFAENMASRLP